MFLFAVLLSLPAAGFGQDGTPLLEKRAGHATELTRKIKAEESPEEPPADAPVSLIRYPTELGDMAAYLTLPPEDTEARHPAIVWLTGGFPAGGGGSYLWEGVDVSDEQSARIYHLNDIVMMYPSTRGGYQGNPGFQEYFYGEVNDVLSALEYVRKLDYVDPSRIYLGGHSTGGTLALLVAAATDQFAGVIALGPTADGYGSDVPYSWTEKERALRAPVKHLSSIRSPTWVIEGEKGNHEALKTLAKENHNPLVKVFSVTGASHFTVLHPVNTLFAKAIRDSPDGTLELDGFDIKNSYLTWWEQDREIQDLQRLTALRRHGIKLSGLHGLTFYLYATQAEDFAPATAEAKKAGYTVSVPVETTFNGQACFEMLLLKAVPLSDLETLFATTAEVFRIAEDFDLYYDGWTTE